MQNWEIGLNAWIIQDGNYKDFKRNEIREFALEFYFKKFSLCDKKSKKFTYLNDCLYEVVAQVIFKNDDVCIIDFGILAYDSETKFQNINVGDYLNGELYLSIDPFDYFESLFEIKGIPPLIYTWRIDKITLETTPIIETKDNYGRTILAYDKSRYSSKEIEKSDAWKEEESSADYILSCFLLSEKPKHSFANF